MSASEEMFHLIAGVSNDGSRPWCDEARRILDAHAAEVRRGDADRLHDERKQYRGRDRFCGGIEHAVGLLKQWAEKTTTPEADAR